jgi:hypothetical protein
MVARGDKHLTPNKLHLVEVCTMIWQSKRDLRHCFSVQNERSRREGLVGHLQVWILKFFVAEIVMYSQFI